MKLIILFFSLLLPLLADISLSESELKLLDREGSFVKQNREDKSGMIVFDISRDIDEVMDDVINFREYSKKIDDIEKVEIYFESEEVISARIFVSTFLLDFNNHVIHEIDREKHTMSWHLDEKKENYFKVMDGSWRFEKVNNKTRVYYFNHIEFKQWAPKFLEEYLLEKGLYKATEWIREE